MVNVSRVQGDPGMCSWMDECKGEWGCECAALKGYRCRLINSLSIILQKDLYIKSSTVNIYVYDCHINYIYIYINLRIILLHVILLYCSM